jgi:hypothetical protein
VRGHETDAGDAFDPVDGGQQVGEVLVAGFVLAVGVDVLTEEGDFPVPLAGKFGSFAATSGSGRLRSRPRTYGTMQ